LHAGATAFREKGEEPAEELDLADDSVRSQARADAPIPTPPFWGVREIPVDLDEVYRHLDTHVLFKLHWGGRGVKGEAWQTLLRGPGGRRAAGARRDRRAGGHGRRRGDRADGATRGRRRIRRAAVRPRPRGADRRGTRRVAALRGSQDA